MKKLLFIILGLTIAQVSYSQRFGHVNDKFSCYDFGVFGGLSQLRSDYSGIRSSFENWDYAFAYGITVRKNFNYDYYANKWHKRFDKRVVFRLGLMHFVPENLGYSDTFKEMRNHRSNIYELHFLAEYNFIKLNTSRDVRYNGYVITPFAGLGFAVSAFNVKDMFIGENIYDNMKFAPAAMLAIGGKAAIFPGVTLTLEASYRLAFTDELDGFDKANTKTSDNYYFIGLGLNFNIGEMKD